MNNLSIHFGDTIIQCEVVDDSQGHAVGLSKHSSLDESEGMLFVFDRIATRQFWMSRVSFPIDIIGLDSEARVTKIVANAKPGSLQRWAFPDVAAVLEVNGGLARIAGLKVGDMLETAEDMGPPGCRVEESENPPTGEGILASHDDRPKQDYVKKLWGDDLGDLALNAEKQAGLKKMIAPAILGLGLACGAGGACKHEQQSGESASTQMPAPAPPAWAKSPRLKEVFMKGWEADPTSARRQLQRLIQEGAPEDEQAAFNSGLTLRMQKSSQLDEGHQLDEWLSDQSESYLSTLSHWCETHGQETDPPAAMIDWIGEINWAPVRGVVEFPAQFGDPAQYADEVYRRSKQMLQMGKAAGDVTELFGDEESDEDDEKVLDDLGDLTDLFESDKPKPKKKAAKKGDLELLERWRATGRTTRMNPEDIATAVGGNARAVTNALERLVQEGLVTAHSQSTRVQKSDDFGRKPFGAETQTWRSYSIPGTTKKAQIVDEDKFVSTVATTLAGKVDEMVWTPDALNGGKTERCVVTRRDLARWLSGDALPAGENYILQSAATDRGLSLVGDAFILGGIADEAKMGFSGSSPTLVLYRDKAGQGGQ